jgi:hypothetical protein
MPSEALFWLPARAVMCSRPFQQVSSGYAPDWSGAQPRRNVRHSGGKLPCDVVWRLCASHADIDSALVATLF